MMYEPAEDSWLILNQIGNYVKPGMKVLDMGTGSGILAEEVKYYTKDILAVDINPEAVEHVQSLGIEAIESDLFENVEGKFDIILFNPPYLPEDPDEPEDSKLMTTGGIEGNEILTRFFKLAKQFLKQDGKVLFVCSTLTGDVEEMLRKTGFKAKIIETEKVFFEELQVYLAEPQWQ
ncbi:methyltransferase [Candidatus Woesearchaeota archaeon]|nr:methyltransferase [Candidatus Woesearchaeota archaeon]